jgi:hypothetical protein
MKALLSSFFSDIVSHVFRVEGERVTGRLKLQHMQPGSYLTLDRRRHTNNRGRTHMYIDRKTDRIEKK